MSVVGVVGGTAAAPTLAGSRLQVSGPITVNGRSASAKAIQPGAVIRGRAAASATSAVVAHDAGAPTITLIGADLELEAEGPIEAVDVAGSTIQVLGQLVKVDALTEIVQEAPDGTPMPLTLKDLAVNDLVEVSGFASSSGILATRIERQPSAAGSTAANQVQLSGIIANLDSTKKTFTIGGELIDYSAATVTGTLANGAEVEVAGTVSGRTLTASQVQIDVNDQESNNDEVELDGVIDALDTTAKTFHLGDKTIDFAAVSNPPNLSNGARVEVQGVVDAKDTTLIHATQIRIEEDHGGSGSADDEAEGKVTAIDTTNLLISVGTVGFYFDSQTVLTKDDVSIKAGDIHIGDVVQVKFDDTKAVNGRAYATSIEVQTAEGSDTNGNDNAVEGSISSFDSSKLTFVVDGATIEVNSSTVYENLDKMLTQADFFGTDRTGQHVVVYGSDVAQSSGPSGSEAILATHIQLKSQ